MNNKSYNVNKINNYTYKLNINSDIYDDTQYRNILYKSVLNFISHGFYSDSDHTRDNLYIYFTCENLKSFQKYMEENENILTYEETIKIIHSLSIQINYLLDNNYGFYGIDKEDIIVINNKYFIIVCPDKLFQIDENENESEDKNLIIYKSINIPFFHNPEIKNIYELKIKNKNKKYPSFTTPALINYKCIYYSIGILIIYCLFGLENINNIEEDLEIIHSTKIYFFLQRCFDENISDRYLLLI
jgi:hypothetical protein